MKSWEIPSHIDDQLWNWGRCFRDRHRWGRCGSAEGGFKPHSDDFAKEGWGDVVTPPKVAPARSNATLEAIRTNDQVMQLNAVQRWACTYFFCYPSLPRFVVLKALRKYANRRLNWTQYMEQVDLARIRVWAMDTTFREKTC